MNEVDDSPRQEYVLDSQDPWNPDDAQRVCGEVLDLLRPRLGRVTCELDPGMPAEDHPEWVALAAEAENRLRRLAKERLGRDPGWAVDVEPGDEQMWVALREYAHWSVRLELWSPSGDSLEGCFDDDTGNIWAKLTAPELADMNAALAEAGSFVTFGQLKSKRKAEARRARLERRARLTEQLRSSLHRSPRRP